MQSNSVPKLRRSQDLAQPLKQPFRQSLIFTLQNYDRNVARKLSTAARMPVFGGVPEKLPWKRNKDHNQGHVILGLPYHNYIPAYMIDEDRTVGNGWTDGS